MTIDLAELDDENEGRKDFRRANGAPLVSDPVDPTKTQRYRRPSGYGKNLDDENALVEWRIWKAMEGVASSKSLAAEVASTKDDDKPGKKVLKEKAMDRGKANEAADMGTALHAMTARVEDAEDGWEPPEHYQDDLLAYGQLLEDFGLVSEMVEVHIVNDEFRAAGTADRIYRLTKPLLTPTGEVLDIGTLVLADLKTGKNLDFSMPGYCIQMALYASGKLYDIHTEKRLATPPIDQDWGLLVHLPVGKAKAELLWCPLQLGLYGSWLANEVKLWQSRWKSGRDGYDMPPVEVYIPAPDSVVDRLAAEGVGVAEVATATMEEMVAYTAARIRTIAEHEEAKKSLILWWPTDCPTPKSGKLINPDDMVRVLNVLDKVEANYSIPFQHTDPRGTMGHKSTVDRSNDRGLTTNTKEAKDQ